VPGIPIAIACPGAHVTLIESTQKKAAFLDRAAQQLGLDNVRVCSTRAEELARTPARQSFDVVVARALAAMNVLAEWCLPLVKIKGKLFAMKGARIAEELPAAAQAIRTLGGGDAIVHAVELPGTSHHVIVEIPKLRSTERRFPRSVAQIKERPL
jgi:16S rRNA (guanine527-N7)-methyltransferase